VEDEDFPTTLARITCPRTCNIEDWFMWVPYDDLDPNGNPPKEGFVDTTLVNKAPTTGTYHEEDEIPYFSMRCETKECQSYTMTCMAGTFCVNQCYGPEVCKRAVFDCADAKECHIDCKGPSACSKAVIRAKSAGKLTVQADHPLGLEGVVWVCPTDNAQCEMTVGSNSGPQTCPCTT